MELFVVNRHEETQETEANSHQDEESKLAKTLKRIERNKKRRQTLKERAQFTAECIQRTKKHRAEKAKIIKVPDTFTEFIDENIEKALGESKVVENEEKVSKKKKKKQKVDAVEGFTILGVDEFKKKNKVARVLPRWLTNPKIISVDLKNLQTKASSVKQLDKRLRLKLKENGIKYLFPVQAEVIPWLLQTNKIRDCLQPNDICVSAPTGSGKTLTFVLPIVQALLPYNVKKIRALVILPTQDLALQVFKTFRMFTADTNINVCLITGKTSFQQEQKQLIAEYDGFEYVSKIDILICTAGRLVDHLKTTQGFTLEYLEYLVIDEADRVLDNVQNDWLYHLEKHIYKDGSSTGNRILNVHTLSATRPPQKLLFSATLSQDPEKLQKLGLFQPKLFTSIVEGGSEDPNAEVTNHFIGKYTTPKELTEKYIVCSIDLKPLVLYEFIKTEKLTRTMVFTHSLESTHRLKVLLKSLFKEDMRIEEIGSNLEHKIRNKLIDDFQKGEIDILVCTDAMARGIDLAGVKCVISYSAPKYLKTYIHRAGRTARAGEDGLAVTLVHKAQLSKFQTLLEQASKLNLEEIKINEEQLEPLGEQYNEALSLLKKIIVQEEAEDLKKTKSAKRVTYKKRKRVNSE